MKNLLILSASGRNGGNSDLLCEQFAAGAAEAGHSVMKIRISEKSFSGCIGCKTCRQNGGACIQEDDMKEILERMLAADVIVLASPVYFYSINGQLKQLIDRTYSQVANMACKEFYYILTCSGPGKQYLDTAIETLRGFVRCLPEAKECGIVYGYGAAEKGDIKTSSAMQEAFEMGRQI